MMPQLRSVRRARAHGARFVERRALLHAPRLEEEPLELLRRRPGEAQVGVAPAEPAFLNTRVVVGEVEAAGEAQPSVDEERLSVIALPAAGPTSRAARPSRGRRT
jgi:hypothetical protein